MVSIPTGQAVLAFESSADQASAAIIADGVACQHLHAARHGHAALITELARSALEEAGLAAREVTHVARAAAGILTGIRGGARRGERVCACRWCQGAWRVRLAAKAYAARRARPDLGEMPIVATADTRRGSFFCQVFDGAGPVDDSIIELDGETPADIPNSWSGAAVIGAGAEAIAAATGGTMACIADLPALDALQVARLAAQRMQAGTVPEPLTPLYVAPAFLGPPAG